jgi:hypothetical protein
VVDSFEQNDELSGSIKGGDFLSSSVNISFSRTILVRGVS